MADLVFYGGINAVTFGNQQFTMRNLTFYNAVTAINQTSSWGWTYKSVTIKNCSTGLNMSTVGANGPSVGSITFIDSSISDTKIGIATIHPFGNATSSTVGSLILENVQLDNVGVAISGPRGSTLLAGTTGATTIAGWGQGHSYVATPISLFSSTGPNPFQGPIEPFTRPLTLLEAEGKFYERSKPQYETVPLSQFVSVRSAGAKGDAICDDTDALQRVISIAAQRNLTVFFDLGIYRITRTLYIPHNSKIAGESYPVIMSSGGFFADMSRPQPVVRVGYPGEVGSIEWTDMIVSTQGHQPGAILFEINLAAPPDNPTGLWDVHARIGKSCFPLSKIDSETHFVHQAASPVQICR